MQQLTMCMCNYCYYNFRKSNESLFGMPTCRPETDTE